MRIRNVKKEFEAHLSSPANGTVTSARGKAEWKEYQDGSRRIKISVTKVGQEDGTLVDVVMDGRLIDQIVLERGIARYRRESERGEQVPTPAAGQLLQIVCFGILLLEGRFVEE